MMTLNQNDTEKKWRETDAIPSMYGIFGLQLVDLYGKCREIYQSHGLFGDAEKMGFCRFFHDLDIGSSLQKGLGWN